LYEHARARIAAGGAGEVSLAPVYCLGLCAQSPAVMIDGRPHARVTPEKLDALLASAQEAGPWNASSTSHRTPLHSPRVPTRAPARAARKPRATAYACAWCATARAT